MDSDDQDVVLALPSGKDRQSVERVDPAKKRRKSKKEVFAETSTNTTNDTMGATDINTQETLPLSGLPDDLNSTETTAANLPVNEDSADWLAEQEKMLLGGDVPAPSEDSTAGTWFNQQRPPSPIIPTAESIALSKFQQQLSGEWNSRVLRREEYTGSSLDTNPTSSFPAMSDTLNDDMNDAENFVFNDSFSESIPLSDIPEDLSITSPATVLMSPEAATTSTTSSTDPDQYREKGRVLLAQLDKDYNALRQQLVNFLENIPPEQSKKEDVRV